MFRKGTKDSNESIQGSSTTVLGHVSWPSGAASKEYDCAADASAGKALIAQAL